MSRAPEPATAAAGQLRPAPQPSRTGGRGSRENLSGAPRRIGGDSSEANQRQACALRHHPAPTDQLREAGWPLCACGVSPSAPLAKGLVSQTREPRPCGSELSLHLGLPDFSATASVHTPGSLPQMHVRCHPRAPSHATLTERLLFNLVL